MESFVIKFTNVTAHPYFAPNGCYYSTIGPFPTYEKARDYYYDHVWDLSKTLEQDKIDRGVRIEVCFTPV